MSAKRFLLGLGWLLLLVAPQASVSAHADLVAANPEINETLDASPAQIELFFSEAVVPGFSTIRVLDDQGNRVDNDDARVDPVDNTRLTVSVRSLGEGVYTVSWKALSAVDSHVTAGAYPFAVGDIEAAALAAASQASQGTRLAVGEVLARWALYLGAAVLTGGMVFINLVWQPSRRDFQSQATEQPFPVLPWRSLARGGLVLLVIADITRLLVQGGQLIDREIIMPWNPLVFDVLFTTRFGVLWLARLALIAAVVWLIGGRFGTAGRWVVFLLMLALLLTVSLGSHAAAEPQPVLPIFADWLHMLGAAVWVGGLFFLAAGLHVAYKAAGFPRLTLVRRLLPRFSSMALVCVGVLTLSGGYSAYLRVGSFSGLVTDLYGQILIIKTVIAVGMVALGAVNLLVITPRVKRLAGEPNSSLFQRFRQSVSGEVALAVLILLAVGLFTAIPPVRATATEAVVRDARRIEDLRLELEIKPGKVGVNTFSVTVLAEGEPVETAREVALLFTPTTVDVPPSKVLLTHQGGGIYAAEGAFLSLPDNWQVQAAVRRVNEFDSFVNYEIELREGQAAQLDWHIVAGVILFAAAVLMALAAQNLGFKGFPRRSLSLMPAAALVIAGFSIIRFEPEVGPVKYINPVPPNSVSVSAGQVLYQQHCLACHGPTGKGDGPIGLTLNPRPADLSLHTAPGVHPDGQLYEWITFGFPGAPMPAFETAIEETDRWHLVNYIRTFSGGN
jgi:copper transport protein